MARDYNKVKVTKANVLIMGRKIARREAALCAILTVLEENGDLDDVLGDVDWDAADNCASEAGVREWFAKHRAGDDARGAQLRVAALAKLSPADKRALGLEG